MPSLGLPNAILTGITTGSILALGAIGVALIYRIADVPNFAHGELFTLGAYFTLVVNAPAEVLSGGFVAADGTLGAPGLGFVFLVVAVSTLGSIYLLGGRDALAGSWWPTDADPRLAVAVHVLAAVLIGALVVLAEPSVLAGFLFAVPLVVAVSLLQELYVYRHFRGRGAELATLLIVALGLSLFLRNGVIAVFGGGSYSFNTPNTVSVLGQPFYFAAARLMDVYLGGTGVFVAMVNTGLEGRPTVLAVGWSWIAVSVALLVGVAVAAGVYRWRRRDVSADEAGYLLDPRIVAVLAGSAALVLVGAFLAGSGTPPDEWAYATRLRLSPIKASVIAITALAIAGLHLVLQGTKLGTAMRASSDNRELAKVTGINTERVMMATWVVAGVFGAAGGVMMGLLFFRLVPSMGFFLLLPMFAAVILGGGGKISGAIVGSYLVGLAEEVGLYAIPGLSPSHRVPLAFAMLLLVLLVKPEGITGGR